MSWKKQFRPVNSILPSQNNGNSSKGNSYSNRLSWLPEVYQGPTDRIQRYTVYETMDNDHEVHAALDTIADFSTEHDDLTKLPFVISFNNTPSSSESDIINQSLKSWCILNEFTKRIWATFRNTLKFGDQFFIRDPETYKLMWIDPSNVSKVIVNESKGKKIEHYVVKGLDLNTAEMVATNQHDGSKVSAFYSPAIFPGYQPGNASQFTSNTLNTKHLDERWVPADHVVHLSLSDGMNSAWPFGISILEFIHKVFKQKELLEDAILIYRVHRAPERRVFFINTGDMPPNMAQQYLERVKLDVQQKRVPTRNGQGATVSDATVNPMSMLEDYFFAVGSDGQGSKVETLAGGEALGQIDDLRYFNNKMLRALGVPSSYLPSGPDDGSTGYNDGRVGTAFIQEFRFSKVCERYQNQVIKNLDKEFKLFLKHSGVTIDSSLFELKFTTPQSFSEYRRLELDSAKINQFQTLADTKFLSTRFMLKRYLGLSDEEIYENERLWKEEQGNVPTGDSDGMSSLSDAGITSSSIDGMSPDEGFDEDESLDDIELDDTMDDTTDELEDDELKA
jgi:hypothetical protein